MPRLQVIYKLFFKIEYINIDISIGLVITMTNAHETLRSAEEISEAGKEELRKTIAYFHRNYETHKMKHSLTEVHCLSIGSFGNLTLKNIIRE